MTFSRHLIAELDLQAAKLESLGVTAAHDVIVQMCGSVIDLTLDNLQARSEHIHDLPAYAAKVLREGGSTSAPAKKAQKMEKDAYEMRRRASDLKRWKDICMELADRGDGIVLKACRYLEERGEEPTVEAVRAITRSRLPEDESEWFQEAKAA